MNKYKRTCENCTVAKVKCEGHPICTRCSKRNLQCLFRKQRKRGRKSQYPLPRVASASPTTYGGMVMPPQGLPPQAPQTAATGWPGPNPQAFLGMSSVAAVPPNFNSPIVPMMAQYSQHAGSAHLHNMSSVSSLNVPGLVPNSTSPAGHIYGYAPNQQNRVWLMPGQQQQPHHVQGHLHYPMMVRPQPGMAHPRPVPPEYGFTQPESQPEEFKPRSIKPSPLVDWQRRRVEALIGVNLQLLRGIGSELKKSPSSEIVHALKTKMGKVLRLLQEHGSSEAATFFHTWVRTTLGETLIAASSKPAVELTLDSTATVVPKFGNAELHAVGISSSWSKDIPALYISFTTDGTNSTDINLQGNPALLSAFVVEPKLYSDAWLDWGADALAGIFSTGNELLQYIATANTKASLGEKKKKLSFTCMHKFDCLWRSDGEATPLCCETLVRCAVIKEQKEGASSSVDILISFERVDKGGARSLKRSKVASRETEEENWTPKTKNESRDSRKAEQRTDILWITHLFETQLNYAAKQNSTTSG